MALLKFEYMFELLLIIYLVPVIIVLSLLLRLVLWLARNVLRLAGWLVKKGCVLLWTFMEGVIAISRHPLGAM